MSLPTFVMPNLVILRVGTSVHTEVCQKNEDSSRLAFQGHSRSLKPTWIDRLPMTSC